MDEKKFTESHLKQLLLYAPDKEEVRKLGKLKNNRQNCKSKVQQFSFKREGSVAEWLRGCGFKSHSDRYKAGVVKLLGFCCMTFGIALFVSSSFKIFI